MFIRSSVRFSRGALRGAGLCLVCALSACKAPSDTNPALTSMTPGAAVDGAVARECASLANERDALLMKNLDQNRLRLCERSDECVVSPMPTDCGQAINRQFMGVIMSVLFSSSGQALTAELSHKACPQADMFAPHGPSVCPQSAGTGLVATCNEGVCALADVGPSD